MVFCSSLGQYNLAFFRRTIIPLRGNDVWHFSLLRRPVRKLLKEPVELFCFFDFLKKEAIKITNTKKKKKGIYFFLIFRGNLRLVREFNRFRLDGSTLIGVPVFITFVCFTLFWSFCFFLFFLVGITQLEWIGGFYRLYSPFACRPWFIDRRLIPFFFCLFQIPPVHYVIIREGWEDGHRFVVVVVVLYFHRSSKRTWVNGCRHRFLSLWSKNKDKNVSLFFFF